MQRFNDVQTVVELNTLNGHDGRHDMPLSVRFQDLVHALLTFDCLNFKAYYCVVSLLHIKLPSQKFAWLPIMYGNYTAL